MLTDSYGFVPTWKLEQRPNAQPSALNALLCLPKLFQAVQRAAGADVGPAVPPKDAPAPRYESLPTPVPPSPITAPTPTETPFHWLVPEPSAVLYAFLALIYPVGTFTSTPTAPLTSPNMAALVLRASMGYQSAKALGLARDALGSFASSHPIETYAFASYFKFRDTAQIASRESLRVPEADWPADAKQLMGRRAVAALQDRQAQRLSGLHGILDRPLQHHSAMCPRTSMLQSTWDSKVTEVRKGLNPASDLIELCAVDVRGGHCGDCLVKLGEHVRSCLELVRLLP